MSNTHFFFSALIAPRKEMDVVGKKNGFLRSYAHFFMSDTHFFFTRIVIKFVISLEKKINILRKVMRI